VTQDNFDSVKKEPAQNPVDSSNLSIHNEFIDKLDSGNVTAEELKTAFESAVANKDTIYAELNKLSKNEIVKQYGAGYLSSSDKKDRYISQAYHQILMGYRLDSGMFSYGGGEESYVQAMRRDVNKTTDADIKAHAEDLAEARKERAEKKVAALNGMENPATFTDYVRIINAKINDDSVTQAEAIMSLPIEQRESFDKLWAEKTRANEARELISKITS